MTIPAAFEPVSDEQAARIRRRFPAVPERFSATLDVEGVDARGLVTPGMPRPKLDGVPIPATSLATASTVNIIESDADAWRQTILGLDCDLCGETLARDQRVYMAAEIDPVAADWLLVRGGMHRRCFNATCHWCVHIRERLLAGTMVGCSLPYADTFNEDIFEVVDHDETDTGTHVIAEYRVRRAAVDVAWPFRGD